MISGTNTHSFVHPIQLRRCCYSNGEFVFCLLNIPGAPLKGLNPAFAPTLPAFMKLPRILISRKLTRESKRQVGRSSSSFSTSSSFLPPPSPPLPFLVVGPQNGFPIIQRLLSTVLSRKRKMLILG